MFSRVRFFFSDVRFWIAHRFRRRSGPDADAAPPPEPPPAPVEAEAEAEPSFGPTPEPTSEPTPEPAFEPTPEPTPDGPRSRRKLRRSRAESPKPRGSRIRRPRIRRPELRRPRIRRDRLPSGRGVLAFLAGAVLAGAIAVALVLLDVGGSDEEGQAGPAPRVVIREDQPEAPPDVGFPEFASKNTTRIAGADAVTNSVGAALAAFPSRGGVPGPDAVAMVAEEDWASGIAASVLVSDPIRVPLLVGTREEVPDLVLDALVSLAPPGSSATEDVQLFQVGDVAAPSGLRTRQVTGGNPAEVAARIEALRQRLTDSNPKHIVLASSDEPAFAMPAAAWAARSGDPVLFVQRDSVPQATLNVLERYEDVPVFLLGPESVVSDTVVDELEDAGVTVERVGGEEPVTNAIAFARYVGVADFGWNITDPGHGLVFANAGRPADAGASSVLSASGTWGPLLLVSSAEELPPALEGYLLDIKPGYVEDPTRAVYNQGWVIGDSSAISVDVQAQIDDLLELTQVQSGTGGAPALGPAPGTPEDIPDADQPNP